MDFNLTLVRGKQRTMESCWMNLPMGELEKTWRELSSDKAWEAWEQVLAVRDIKILHIPVIAPTPQQFEVYATYE